ncbi:MULTISPECIES: ferrous iron transport protein B [unclassified Bacillus (in: firmicutes)]|uniref:ferrous iron transport protein B n=1 Tax=unclassified Bacillus (in: firmicutes) TaxID=185979 RepID=UPI0008DFF33F|nr:MULTISPECIES: ferrous iron transport protein B [unclassified Bacillus (in: firmicutes)]SFA89807.1 ferrous iron transport protein B [Bacillus sp. UNCCL13]SFQ85038.1 ferrous iron transport protein B [Bacillus sp. cl95]
MLNIALIGNPNTGKTSLFNNLTGTYQYVGNWSGVTVEKKVGVIKNKRGNLIDLPGIYSLSPLSKDEAVVSNFFVSEPFDGIINIVDASQIERNLMLTLQLLEFEKPTIIGLNMTDVAKRRGMTIDDVKLSELLDVPVVPVIARTGKGTSTINELITDKPAKSYFKINYGNVIEDSIESIAKLLPSSLSIPKRWTAIQLLEGNDEVKKYIASFKNAKEINLFLEQINDKLRSEHGVESAARWIYLVRKDYISQIIQDSVIQEQDVQPTVTEKIDRFTTHPILGIPIFLATMFLMFKLTFDWVGLPLSDLLDGFLSGTITNWLTSGLSAMNASNFIKAVVLDGIVAGVGGVLVFVPQIFMLFLIISFLEDSGYMSRAALVMDRTMEMVGLNGKAFIPMIIGFGCNVPGVMAARTIETPRERLLTILLTPLMSCSARLPVYALFVGAFFAKYQALVVFSLYVLGIVVALVLAKIFSLTILKGEFSLFVVELPPYRMPQGKALFRSTWDKGKGFIKKAGTFIFGGSVLIWFLSYAGPSGFAVPMDDSFLAMIGGVLAPILAPLGFGSWQAGASLLTGFLAKEVVVSAMNIIYHVPNADTLQGLLATEFSALSAFSFMVFVLLYVPCLATVATIRKESGSTKWTYFSVAYALVIAYMLSLVIYQVGRLLGY